MVQPTITSAKAILPLKNNEIYQKINHTEFNECFSKLSIKIFIKSRLEHILIKQYKK
jgi:hypothetical protein